MSFGVRPYNALQKDSINGNFVKGRQVIDEQSDNLATQVSLDFRTDSFNESVNFPVVFGTDGTVTQDSTGVTIASVPYTVTVVEGNEHVKWLKFYKDNFIVPEKGEVFYELQFSVEQSIPSLPAAYLPRVRNQFEDIRLCSSAMNMIDTTTWMVYDFLVADQAIYAFYERLPNGKPGFVPGNLPDYEAFSSCKLVGKRTNIPANDYMTLAIAVRRKSVRWLVNNQEVWRIERAGIRPRDEFMILNHGGPDTEVEVTQVQCGFGNFSLLDMGLPDNYSRVLTLVDGGGSLVPNRCVNQLAQIDATANYRELYKGVAGTDRALTTIAGEPNGTFAVDLATVQGAPATYKLWGQGCTLRIRTFKVYVRQKVNDVDAQSVIVQ